jgi:hypothetical protein
MSGLSAIGKTSDGVSRSVVGVVRGLKRGIFSFEIIASGIVSELGVTESCRR